MMHIKGIVVAPCLAHKMIKARVAITRALIYFRPSGLAGFGPDYTSGQSAIILEAMIYSREVALAGPLLVDL